MTGDNMAKYLLDTCTCISMFRGAYSAFKEYGEIRYALEHCGQRVDQFDLLIGATALHNNLTLVTSNTKHFLRMKQLQIENWK